MSYLDGQEDKIQFNRNNLKPIQFNKNFLSNIEGEEMKGITLRKDGRYVIRKMINGKSIIKYANTLHEAKIIYNKIKKNREVKKVIKPYSLEKWITEWLEIYKKPFVSEKQYKEIKCGMNHILKKFKNYYLKNINTLELQEYVNSLPKNKTKTTIQLYFNALLQKAEDLSLIEKNPFKAVIKDKKLKYKNSGFNIDEQKVIINAIKNSEIETEILIYLMTGCRPNELPNKENFDFINNTVTINGTKNTNALKRVIELSHDFSNYMQNYFKNNNLKEVKFISQSFKKICQQNNISNPLLYRLRHTFATNHFILGTHAKYVQQWLGHYSVSFTLDTYTDIDKNSSPEKIQKLYNNFYYEIK